MLSHRPNSTDALLAKALARLAEDEAQVKQELALIIAADTSFPPGTGYGAFADLLERLTAPLGFDAQRVSVPQALWDAGVPDIAGERVNLIAARRNGRPVCSLYFHVDCVPPGDGWTHPPLQLTVDGRTLYGRGTADMKGTIASALAAIRAAVAVGLPLAFDPVLLFCTDEEGGLYPGIRYLAEQGLVEGHLLSFNGGAVPRIWAGCFGSLDLRIEIEGRAAHSGEPGDGVNAIEAAIPLLTALRKLKAVVEQRTSALPPPPRREGRPLTARLNVTAAHGGDKGSSLPGRFTLLVNRRYAPEERFEDVLAELEMTVAEAMKGSGALGFTTRVVGHLAPVADPTGPHWPRWQAALSEGFGWPMESFSAYGASSSSDMGWVQAAGIREILLGGLVKPGCGAHGADEHTTLDDVMALARSILLYLAEAFPGDGPNTTKPEA
ncbi:M20 family metallopeptidase [Chelatococcus sp. GCM10030263]|uniref:M20 family metallopeptidase n=1 Tax=Chelatococcus sp. GCM10030263 TaxID=3273387 RepID=UPI003607AB1E